MSSVFVPFTDATTIDHSTSATFVSPHEANLIVARKNLLQIFRFVYREEDLSSGLVATDEDQEGGANLANEDDFLGSNLRIQSSERQMVSKLVLVAEHRLFGTITSLCGIRDKSFSTTGLESLLVSFESAKASLLRWSQDLHDVVTISLHSFEREEYRSPLRRNTVGCTKVDPLCRVVTMSFYNDHLAFMPILQEDDLLIEEDRMSDKIQGAIANSFVLSAAQLEDDITHLLDFSFVDGYREPALALLYSTESTTTGLLKDWKRDVSKLVVLTLDLQAGARTAIFEVSDLPADLKTVVMVPNPVGGCLLLGANEIVYVDPASRIVALAVNDFAQGSSALPMRDYSHLNLRLEGALAVPLQDGVSMDGIAIILANGSIALLTLNLDGRTVSSLHLKVVSPDFGGDILLSGASCATVFSGKRLFVGSRTGDGRLLAWRKRARPSAVKNQGDQLMQDAVLDVKEEEGSSEKDDLEDLYGDEATQKKFFGAETTTFDLRFYSHDTLQNPGPIAGMTIASQKSMDDLEREDNLGVPFELATVGGTGRAGNLTIHQRSIVPEVIGKFDSPDWQALWTVKVKSSTTELDDNVANSLDTYLMATKESETQVFTIDTAFIEKTDSEFETSDSTVSVGTIMNFTCIVQICADMMRTYDADLKLLEMKPTPEGRTIIAASIMDPYVLLTLDDATLALYSSNSSTKELIEIEHRMTDKDDITCAILYNLGNESTYFETLLHGSPKAEKSYQNGEESADDKVSLMPRDTLCFTMTKSGCLKIYRLPSMEIVFSSEAASTCPLIITNDQGLDISASSATNNETSTKHSIVEIVIAPLGQHVLTPTLIFRTRQSDIVMYRPYVDSQNALRFSKVRCSSGAGEHRGPGDINLDNDLQQTDGQSLVQHPVMVCCPDIGGYACVYVNNDISSYWIMQNDHSQPRLRPAGMSDVRSLSGFNTLDAQAGFIYCDRYSVVRICKFATDLDYTNFWSTKTVRLGRSVHSVAYHAAQHVYVVLTTHDEPFEIPDEEDDDWQPKVEKRENLPLLPRGSVDLIDARNFQHIDRYELGPNEQGLCLKSVLLTIATDYTRKKRACLAVSTGLCRGEDLAMRGAVYIFDVVEVVPDPGQPDSLYRLKNVCREEVKAAATTLCEIDGYLLSSQGQKVVFRSLEEDERLTPVAFVDLGLATTTSKCLRSMVLFGDVLNGVRFVGFGEEPYKVTNFGRDYESMDVMDAEFMVDGSHLYFAASDPLGNLRVLQYDPENPLTLAGSRLIRRSDMHVGHVINCMLLLPKPTEDSEDQASSPERTLVLCGSQDGSLGALIPISERSYRRLYTVQAQLASNETHIAGLNPRAYRLCTTEGATSNAARGILDGQLLCKFADMDSAMQFQTAKKSGVNAESVVNDLAGFQMSMRVF